MLVPRCAVVVALMSVSACAGRYHSGVRGEFVGRGNALVQPRTTDAGSINADLPPWTVGGGIDLPAGTYDLALWFDVPRAQLIDWTLSCPGIQLTGTDGESFEHYRARRMAEVRATHPQVASRGVETVASERHLLGSVQLGPADPISDQSATADAIELPPEDLGAARLITSIRVTTTSRGVCAVTAATDDAAVIGTYQITRARGRATAQSTDVIVDRSRLPALLPAFIDPEAQARARAAAEAQWQLEADARDAVRAQEEALPRPRAIDLDQHRLDLALQARELLHKRWQAWGAIPRPSMPAPFAETPGEAPYPGAVWTNGRWYWIDGRWTWRPGSWSNPDVFETSEYAIPTEIAIGLGLDESGEPIGRGPREKLRDHRHPETSPWGGHDRETVRDHRHEATSEPARASHDDTPRSTIRDHRDDKKDDNDNGREMVRDHRHR